MLLPFLAKILFTFCFVYILFWLYPNIQHKNIPYAWLEKIIALIIYIASSQFSFFNFIMAKVWKLIKHSKKEDTSIPPHLSSHKTSHIILYCSSHNTKQFLIYLTGLWCCIGKCVSIKITSVFFLRLVDFEQTVNHFFKIHSIFFPFFFFHFFLKLIFLKFQLNLVKHFLLSCNFFKNLTCLTLKGCIIYLKTVAFLSSKPLSLDK